MKWFLIIISWYGSNVPMERQELHFETEAKCRAYSARYEQVFEDAGKADKRLGIILGECARKPD